MNEEKAILSKDNFIHNSIKDAFLQLLLKKKGLYANNHNRSL